MPVAPLSQRVTRFLLLLVLGIAVMYFGREVLVPLAMAVLLTFILSPIVGWLEHRRIPRVAAIGLVMLVIAGAIFQGGWVLTRQLADLAENLPTYKENLESKFHSIQHQVGSTTGLSKIFDSLSGVPSTVRKSLPFAVDEGVESSPQSASQSKPPSEMSDEQQALPVKVIDTTSPWNTVAGYLGTITAPLVHLAVILVLLIFMLLEREELRNRVIRLAGDNLTLTTRTLDEVGHRVSSYLLALAMVCGSYGLAMAVGLWLIGVPYAFVWGCLAGLVRFMPYIGPFVGDSLPMAMALISFPAADWIHPAATAGLILTLEVVSNNFVEPLAYGRSTGVSVVALLVAATFWTWVWGPIGLMMSVPLTVILAVIGEHVPGMEALGVLLSDKPALKTDVVYYQRLLADDFDEACALFEDYREEHGQAASYDQLIVPALAAAERDRLKGELDDEQFRAICHTARTMLDESQQAEETPSADACPSDAPRLRASVVGVASRGPTDEIGLWMLKSMLTPCGGSFDVLKPRMLVSEIVARFDKQRPDAVCIAALGPIGSQRAVYLCKRLRTRLPDVRIVVMRLGASGDRGKIAPRLTAAGADRVTFSLAETCDGLQRMTPLEHAES